MDSSTPTDSTPAPIVFYLSLIGSLRDSLPHKKHSRDFQDWLIRQVPPALTQMFIILRSSMLVSWAS